MMKKNYVTPGIELLPMQIVGPNAAVSPNGEDNGGGMHPIEAKEAPLDEESFFGTPVGWDE